MAESFLTSKIGCSALRRGISNISERVSDDDDEGKPEEDDYDALNDETFGIDCSGDGLDDWEEGHEHFALLDDHFGNGGLKSSEHVNDSSNHHNQSQSRNDKPQKSELFHSFSYDEDETNNIEDSINQLVLDDDVEDPAIVGMLISKPISTYGLSESRTYNISPPPPAIVESDHVGSPSTSSIWSTPKGETNKGFASSLFNPFRNASPIVFDLQLMDPCIIKASNDERSNQVNSSSKLIPNMKTLEEIENELLNSNKTTVTMKALDEIDKDIPLKKGILTVGELEQNLNLVQKRVKTPLKKPIGPPPGFSNRATYARKPDISVPFSPLSTIVNPSITVPGSRLTGSPSHLSKSMSPTSSLISCNTKSSPLARPIHYQSLRPNLIIPPQLTHPSAFRAAPYIGQYAAGHPLMVGHVPYPSPYKTIPFVLGYQDKREAISNFSCLPPGVHPNRVNIKGGFNYNNGWNSRDSGNYLVDVDEYANLMSRKEKEWLITIQMIQLQSDNPYLDDFYYTSYMMKKRVKETKEKEPTLVIPERSKVVETRTYKPVQYEGSLGKLQAGSVTCPRKMIDVHTVHTDESESDTQKLANRDTKRLRQLLLDIEKLYSLVLQADDIDKRVIILPEEARLPLYENKKETIGKLYSGFIQNEGSFFIHMAAIRKGRNLITRSIPLFSKEQLIVLLNIIFSHLSIILKRDTTEQMGFVIYDHYTRLLSSCGLDTLHLFGERLCSENEESSGKSHCQFAMEHKIGIAYVCDMISRAEEIYLSELPASANIKTQWERVVSTVLGCLEMISLPKTTNYIPKPTFLAHLQRFSSNGATITLVNEWINRLPVKVFVGNTVT